MRAKQPEFSCSSHMQLLTTKWEQNICKHPWAGSHQPWPCFSGITSTAAASTAHTGRLRLFKLEENIKKEITDWRQRTIHRKPRLISPLAHRKTHLNFTGFCIETTAQTHCQSKDNTVKLTNGINFVSSEKHLKSFVTFFATTFYSSQANMM